MNVYRGETFTNIFYINQNKEIDTDDREGSRCRPARGFDAETFL